MASGLEVVSVPGSTKEGRQQGASNNRTIALLAQGNKVLLQILQWRLEPYMEREMPVEQAGF